MRKLLLLSITPAAVAAIVLAMPGMASASHGGASCAYTDDHDQVNVPVLGGDPDTTPGGDRQVDVYAGADADNHDVGSSGAADAAAGVCTNNLIDASPDARFDGGTAEVGVGVGKGVPTGVPGVYAVADGDNQNHDPLTSMGTPPEESFQGYIGVSNFETGTPEAAANCTTPNDVDNGGGTNSGGCVVIREAGNTNVAVPLLACGNDSGKNWDGAGRDGCTIDIPGV